MKIIFLDIDGVLNTEHGLKALSKNWTDMEKTRDKFGNLFCSQAVDVLRQIIEKTGAKIVISSTWRASGLAEMQEMWAVRNLPGEVIAITGYHEDRVRGAEVDTYLRARGWYYPKWYWSMPMCDEPRENCDIEGYCIIDDDRDFFIDQVKHFVHTPAKYGLAGKGKLEECINALNVIPE